MKIFIETKPNAHSPRIERIDRTHFKIAVKEPATENRANEAVIKAIAEEFGIAPSCIKHIAGKTSRKKIFEIKGRNI